MEEEVKSELEVSSRNVRAAEAEPTLSIQKIMFDSYIEINGKDYNYFSIPFIKEEKQIVVSIKVEGAGDINFYILDDQMFSRWKMGEPITDAYVSKTRVNHDVVEWTPPQLGTYRFLFDNTHSPIKKKCKVQIILHGI